MAKKSKTQRAKASAARKERKIEREQEELASAKMAEEAGENIAAAKGEASAKGADAKKSIEPKKTEKAAESKEAKASSDKKSAKPKKQRFQFFRDVRSELRRVTWPTRSDVLRWTGVVVVALLFFGVFVALLDNALITPLLVFISGFGA